MLQIIEDEQQELDEQLEAKLSWAAERSAEAEQLAFDATRMLSCTAERLDTVKNQGFFERCWSSLSGKTGEIERANTADLIHMQKLSYRYISLLQERDLMMAHSMLAIKNNLLTLAVKETETRNLVAELAQRTLDRFERLEERVEQIEVTQNLHGWFLTLSERGYEQRYPTPFFRMLRVINDFYAIRDDDWSYYDILILRKSFKEVGIAAYDIISIDEFITKIIDEIENQSLEKYSELIALPVNITQADASKYAVDNISSQAFSTIHNLNTEYKEKYATLKSLVKTNKLNATLREAFKDVMVDFIERQNISLTNTLPISDYAVEILNGKRLFMSLYSDEKKFHDNERGSL